MARRGRPRQSGKRDKRDRLITDKRVEPPAHILELRAQFSFVTPTKGPDGRSGEIDQDICDGIGQLHALGELDGHGYDSQLLRDTGREWRNWLLPLLPGKCKTGGFERADKGRNVSHYTHRDARFDMMDAALVGDERAWLQTLLIDPERGCWPDGEENTPWVRAIICEGLLKRGKIPKHMMFPTVEDYARLKACIRGLCLLVEAGLPPRWVQAERSAA
jgi:hypothetical protein